MRSSVSVAISIYGSFLSVVKYKKIVISFVKASGYAVLPYIQNEDIEVMKIFLSRFGYGNTNAEQKSLETYLIDKVLPILNKSLEKL